MLFLIGIYKLNDANRPPLIIARVFHEGIVFALHIYCFRDPNSAELRVWPEYNNSNSQYIEFREAPQEFFIRDQLRETYCNFWLDINNKTYSNTQ